MNKLKPSLHISAIIRQSQGNVNTKLTQNINASKSHNISTLFLLLTSPWERRFITETRNRVEVYV